MRIRRVSFKVVPDSLYEVPVYVYGLLVYCVLDLYRPMKLVMRVLANLRAYSYIY